MTQAEVDARATVVAEARDWISTPYHHCSDVKHVGADCAMLMVRVYGDLGLIEKFDPRPYPTDWHLHRDDERYLKLLLERSVDVASPLPGDVVLFKYGRSYSHGGIVTRPTPLTIVHAFMPAKMVIEEDVTRNAQLAIRIPTARYASFWRGDSA